MDNVLTTVVDGLHESFSGLLSILDETGELSLRTVADENFRKSLLLAATSYFERRMTEAVLVFVREATSGNEVVGAFVYNKAVSRQYHTWFQWKENNANSFFGLFGRDFLDFMKRRVRDDDGLADSVRAFMELGRERNRVVHQDYGAVALEKTTEEIYALYCRAMGFVEMVPVALREFEANGAAAAVS